MTYSQTLLAKRSASFSRRICHRNESAVSQDAKSLPAQAHAYTTRQRTLKNTQTMLTACAEQDDARAPAVADDVPKLLTEMVKELAVREPLPPARPDDRARKKATGALALFVSLQPPFLPNKHSI